jgi:hypothetical protein
MDDSLGIARIFAGLHVSKYGGGFRNWDFGFVASIRKGASESRRAFFTPTLPPSRWREYICLHCASGRTARRRGEYVREVNTHGRFAGKCACFGGWHVSKYGGRISEGLP